ncbi:MAG: hypothetical protein ACFE0S_00245 [Rhodospirillales bacterium]
MNPLIIVGATLLLATPALAEKCVEDFKKIYGDADQRPADANFLDAAETCGVALKYVRLTGRNGSQISDVMNKFFSSCPFNEYTTELARRSYERSQKLSNVEREYVDPTTAAFLADARICYCIEASRALLNKGVCR